MGTDATKGCAQTATLNDEAPLDNWPFDFDDSQGANNADAARFNATIPVVVFNHVADTPALQRFDLNQDGIVTSVDKALIFTNSNVYNTTCTAIDAFGHGQVSP